MHRKQTHLEKKHLHQESLYYQPKQCTIDWEIHQIYQTFALFDAPRIGIFFMIPENHLGVSKNRGTPKSSILIGFSDFRL